MNKLVETVLKRAQVRELAKEATEVNARVAKIAGKLGTIKDTHPATLAFRKAAKALDEAEKLLDQAVEDHSYFIKKD